MSPRSQQGLPTITEMVEGFPSTGLQLMTRVEDFFRVARAEVVEVPAVLQGTQATPPRTHTRDSPSGASGPMALGDGSLGSYTAHASFRTEGSFIVRRYAREAPIKNRSIVFASRNHSN